MPSSRLYLVRREVESCIGPLSAQDFGRYLARMSIGLHDEVSGHWGPWAFIEDVLEKGILIFGPTGLFQEVLLGANPCLQGTSQK